MELHKRKKLDIIIERPVMPVVEQALLKAGVTGYTVFAGLSGHGHSGDWAEGMLTSAEQKMMLVVITTPELCDRLLTVLRGILDLYAGVICVSDVEVMRATKF